MYLQHKTQVWDIDVDGVHTFAELYKDPEIENCVYEFELADVERPAHRCTTSIEAEAGACIRRGLVIPAHDFVLRQSHTFNLLDARGAIGVTERAKFFADMRGQAKAVSELYVQQRERLEFPWLKERGGGGRQQATAEAAIATPAWPSLSRRRKPSCSRSAPRSCRPRMSWTASPRSRRNWRRCWPATNWPTARLRVTGTTRRLVAHVVDLAPMQADEIVEKRGPALAQAYDSLGQPTKALEGFARGQGVAVKDLEVRDNYVYAVKRVAGKPAARSCPRSASTC